jgi:exodeoxyribonuclease V gamma subunit
MGAVGINSDTQIAKAKLGNGIMLYGSNDPSVLVEECARQLADPLSDPFKEEEFLVQSRGMGTWLQLGIATHKGIFARGRFRFQEEAVWMILRGFFGEGPEKNPYTKEGMAWKVFDLLPRLMAEDSGNFASLLDYVGEEDLRDGNRVFRLCRQIATLYDSYLTYRPELILGWNESKFPDGRNRWQAILWKELRTAFGLKTLPELVTRLQGGINPQRLDWLPERLSVFGVSTMPPLFLNVLKAYGEVRSLKIFSLQPAPVFWGEVESEKWKLRALKRAEVQAGYPVDENLLSDRTGNPLIGSMGRTGREFFNMLVDHDAHDCPLIFRKPTGNRVLNRVQRWIFDALGEENESILKAERDDDSLVINNCHGPMRETEVLRDYLLKRFRDDPSLQPSEVLVMMPSPEEYASYIRATFGGMEEGMPRDFPFSIVDREPRMESHLIDFFFDLLEFFESRATNREVLDLLDALPSRTKNEWEDGDIEIFRKWIKDCHSYWGFDEAHRARCGSISTNEHTWKHALDRMALGFCMRGEKKELWEDTLPYDEIEGENSIRFSQLFRFLSSLSAFEKQSRGEQNLLSWCDWLARLAHEFFPQNDLTLLDRQKINDAIEDLSAEYRGLAENGVVPLRVIRYHLGNVLEVGSPQGRFLTQGVTFSGLRPMRSVSARVICLLGMNDQAFPRQDRTPSFDLSGERRPGDRSAREDDRYLFLETIWCAKEFLYLSFIGQSIRKAQDIPPSVVVAELLDGLDKIVEWQNEKCHAIKAKDAIVHRQTLHPFAKENFQGSRLPRSFSMPNLKAARALLHPEKKILPFINGVINETGNSNKELSSTDLVEFLKNPAKAFLKCSLGMKLWDEDASPSDCEPLEIDSLNKYKLMSQMSDILLAGNDITRLYELEKAEGGLPPANLGEVWFNESKREVQGFLKQWDDLLITPSGEPSSFVKEIAGFSFMGEISPLRNGKHILFRFSKKFNAKDRVRLWVEHLCGCAFSSIESFQTLFLCADKKYLHAHSVPKTQALQLIEQLIRLRSSGLESPLQFFPKSSYAYHESIKQSTVQAESTEEELAKARQHAIYAAEKLWASTKQKGKRIPGEGDDFSYQTCFGKKPFVDPGFAKLSAQIFEPFEEFVKLETKE